jgi:UDPglucose--hexose-1-phosphate uridylyltransferase
LNELRWDPTLREWVAYATRRQDRTFLPPAEYCPLCPTRPGGFPTEIERESYDIVVFENKFPSFARDAGVPDEPGTPLTPTASGRGVCEVVVYSDDHDATLASLGERRIRNLIEVWADRYGDLGAREEVAYVFIFENKGEAIGVTLHHPHGQIYGFPFIPPRPARELQAAREYREQNDGSCLHCDVLAQEQEDGRRVVVKGEHFTAFIPFYAHFPFEVHLYARRCAPSIADLDANERRDLASVLERLLVGYDDLFGFSLPYMMVMHQAPTDGDDYDGIAHFHIEFYPPNRTGEKLKYQAGSETGAGAFIMDVLPEESAETLRRKIVNR